jgi:hypothetical protein
MATTVEGLFNLPTAAQAGQQYLEGMMSSPAQMNQLSLLQQAAATGRNAGAMVGYGAGRLLGGKAPDEIRIEGVNQAMAEATRIGGTDAEMYANLAKGLAARGLTQDAMAATEKARSAKRDEQAMTLAASQEERAVKGDIRADKEAELRLLEEQRRVIAAQQAKAEYDQRMAMYPLEIQAKGLAILKAEQDLNGAMGEVAMTQEALTTGINPKTGKELTAEEERGLRARLAQATLAINNEAAKIANEKAEHELKMKSYEASIASSKASAKAAESRAASGDFTKAVYSDPDPMNPKGIFVGYANKKGEIIGSNGLPYPNRDDAIRAQLGGGAPAAPAAVNPAAPAANAPAKKPVKPLSEF